jgi:hypothetical protein
MLLYQNEHEIEHQQDGGEMTDEQKQLVNEM